VRRGANASRKAFKASAPLPLGRLESMTRPTSSDGNDLALPVLDYYQQPWDLVESCFLDGLYDLTEGACCRERRRARRGFSAEERGVVRKCKG
jgi:hypothetical protein